MNKLSWFIYLAGVVDVIGGFAGFFAVAGGFAYLIFMIVMGSIVGYCRKSQIETDKVDGEQVASVRQQISLIVIPILVVAVPLAIFVPSRQTMILMAGSEMGERVLKSSTVQDVANPAMDLVKVWIKKETDKLTVSTQQK